MRSTMLALIFFGVFCSITSSAQTTYDVRTYGATCNGSTSDYAAIVAAVGAAGTAGGGIVTGPSAGTCVTSTSQSIDIPANVWLSGFTIGTASGQSMTVSMLTTNNQSSTCSPFISGVRIQNMTLKGGATTTYSGASAISLFCATQSSVTGNTIQNFGWEGVDFVYSTNSSLKDNRFQSIYGDCADVQGLGSDAIVIISNVCDAQGNSTDGGFSANISSSNTIITNNVVKGLAGSSFGIEAAGAHDVLITNNLVESGYGVNGIGVYYNTGPVDSYDVTVSNNIIGAPPYGGFCINVTNPNSSHQKNPIKIVGNQCIGNSSSSGGIYVNGYSVEISSNAITLPSTGSTCVLLDANGMVYAGYMTVHDNILTGCATTVQGGTSPYFLTPMYFGAELVVP